MSTITDELHTSSESAQATDEVQNLRAEVEILRRELAAIRSPRISILKEPLTYEARLIRDKSGPSGLRAVATRADHCYIKDIATYRTDPFARERLERHKQEMRKVGEARERIFAPDVEVDFETRAVNWTAGTGGYFAPPLWLIEWFAAVPTPERVLAKHAPQFELPEGAQSVNLPAWSAGGEVGNAQVGSPAMSTSTIDAAISSAVATIAGNYDVPIQMLEQSPVGAHLDWIAFTNMEARYGYQLELQLLNGTGAAVPQGSGNNQLLGIFNNTAIPSANQVSFPGPSVEAAPGTLATGAQGATLIFSYIGFLTSKIGQSRFLPPEGWLMTTSRGAWLGSSEDLQSRPLMISDNATRDGGWDLLGFPVWLDDSIPRNLGAGGNEERIISCRPSDWIILESERRTQVMLDVLSGTLMARLQMRRYVAALLRYPTSVSYLYGPGMATAGGW